VNVIVESLSAEGVIAHRPALVGLLQDAVDSGASVGFPSLRSHRRGITPSARSKPGVAQRPRSPPGGIGHRA
jgi:hypothetical protein